MTPLQREALQMCLEYIETDAHERRHVRWKINEALAEQPAQPQQEPVAGCVCRWNSEGDRVVTCERHQGWLEVIAEWADRAREAEKKLKVLNTSPPPQRKPLTDEQIETVWRIVQANDFHDCVKPFARAVEAKHNIKGDA